MSAIPQQSAIPKLALLRLMAQSREGDRREGILLRQSKGWFQVGGYGHEALCAMQLSLREDDWLFPYYRSRALMLARGLTTYDLALAYFAKRESGSAGRQMPSHFSSRTHNVFSVCTPTGGSLLPACGTAWGMKLQGKDSVCLASVGDAASRQGEYYEAIAFAVQENLPMVFVIEDNKYGISTPTDRFFAYHYEGILGRERLIEVDGRQLETVHAATAAAVDRARHGDGPTILWMDLDRLSSHTSSDDHRVYRSLTDIEAMQARDPLKLLSDELMASGELTASDWAALQAEIAHAVDEDYRRAELTADPTPADLMTHSWGEVIEPTRPPIEAGPQTMVEAINRTFRQALSNDPDVVFFGEDIEDPKGGVFGITKSLSDAFPHQVFNSPLAEATIMGVAVGLSAYGMRPVFELQFVDFIAPGWNQITTNMSTLRWRTAGEWTCPLVIYAPYGAYLPGGSLWHSQSNEAALAHNPGLRIAIPSTPEDAAGLLWSAIHGDDPTFVLVPKHIFRKRVDVANVEPVPFGRLRVVREGADVTLVTWGNTIELAEAAADALADEVSVEILDLRSIVPWDRAGVVESIAKTGRLVVVQEDIRTGGFAQTVVAEITSDPAQFNLFLAAPQIVSRGDVAIGYNPIYEYAALPSLDDVVAALRTVMA